MTAAAYTVGIAGRRLGVSGDGGMAAFRTAFSGIVDPGGGPLDATLEIETTSDPAGEDPWRDWEAGWFRRNDGPLVVVRRGPSSVETFLPGVVPRLHVAASPAAQACGDLRAQPATYAIASWLESPTVQLVHAGAVALDGRGVLIVGVSGRGKSTTALACAQSGFSFLGDDMCVVEAGSGGGPASVHGIYATAKVNPDSRERLGIRDWQFLGTTPRGKDALALPTDIKFERAVPLVAIVGVRADGRSGGTVRRVAAPAAMGVLAATALRMAPESGTPTLWLRTAASIARQVPAYELGLDWDLERVVAAVRSIVERGSEDRAGGAESTPALPWRR